jgi:hypothetical protein
MIAITPLLSPCSQFPNYSGFQMSMSKVKWREKANRKSVFTGFERTSNCKLSKRENHDERGSR